MLKVLVEAVLNYVRGVQQLTILFNNPALAQVKIQELKGCEVSRTWNAATRRHDFHFRRAQEKKPPAEIDNQQNEELLLRRWMTNERVRLRMIP